ncbi:MOSC domain-containing protein [Rhodococcus sp. X156]|uniref:MOSC domain-containing protein n=1 Tax=Rhodococcus sp. X156 TaxID=2499145 RepID=UPI000FD85451|nr:MOSC domain-containing protein [Rhodococcus sp. X156]
MAAVTRISVTPVKGTALQHPDSVQLDEHGCRHNRLFHFIDPEGRLVNGKQCGPLATVHCEVQDDGPDSPVLSTRLPDGTVLAEPVQLTAERVQTGFYGRPVAGTVVGGPFAKAISEAVGKELRLVRVDQPGAGVDVHPVTVIGNASMDQLRADVAAPAKQWADRFRMLLELDGLAPYEEEGWAGGQVRIGEVVLSVGDRVPRCVVTKQNPADGSRDFNTLDALQSHREGLLLGMYATVLQPGTVHLGDAVTTR